MSTAAVTFDRSVAGLFPNNTAAASDPSYLKVAQLIQEISPELLSSMKVTTQQTIQTLADNLYKNGPRSFFPYLGSDQAGGHFSAMDAQIATTTLTRNLKVSFSTAKEFVALWLVNSLDANQLVEMPSS